MALAVALALLAPASVSGQKAVWTMDSCMQYAVTHASDVQRQPIVTRQNEQNYRRAIADFLPSVGASVGTQYQWGRNVDPETNSYNNVTTFNNNWQLAASLTLFDGFATVNAFRQARLAKQSSQTAQQKVAEDIATEVMQKYIETA